MSAFLLSQHPPSLQGRALQLLRLSACLHYGQPDNRCVRSNAEGDSYKRDESNVKTPQTNVGGALGKNVCLSSLFAYRRYSLNK